MDKLVHFTHSEISSPYSLRTSNACYMIYQGYHLSDLLWIIQRAVGDLAYALPAHKGSFSKDCTCLFFFPSPLHPLKIGWEQNSNLQIKLLLTCIFVFLTCNFTGLYWEFSLKDPFSSWQFSTSHNKELQIEFWSWFMYLFTCPSTLTANAVNL